ncbi:MAG: T9SS type A sorting domain-containing protein [Bacteroidota bacterium]
MKKLLLLLFVTSQITFCKAQQFSFQMFFSDAIGNKDTITLGYDLTATDSIDTAFGETNIISVPLDTNLDVRITNAWFTYADAVYFHLKKQIVFYDCSLHNLNIQPINIVTQHWPVTMTWNNSIFNDSCNNGSVFTGINPAGWWDTGCPSGLLQQVFLGDDSITFNSNFDLGWFGYINSDGDSIPVFWQAFGDSTILTTGINELPQQCISVKVFPNPGSTYITVQANNSFGQLSLISILNSYGQIVLKTQQISRIDISELPDGIYFIKTENTKGEFTTSKFLKL